MAPQKNFLETFNAVIEETKILFTPQPAFFEATTLWAEALQDIYGGADAQETLDELVEEIESTVE
jgi:multiple sugar transport system substrate-binding protein